MKLFSNGKLYTESLYAKECDFEREVVANSRLFFGPNTVYIDAKRKIETKSLGSSIPDGFLFDMSDRANPEFYIVEVELAKHDFYNHIFPQVTKFFGFYKNPQSQAKLVDKIFSIASEDKQLRADLRKYLGDKEIYKFIKDTIATSQNILIVIDGEKKEMPEIMETYSDTWGKMVKHILVRKFSSREGDSIYSMHPDFENIEFSEIADDSARESDDVRYTEEYHFEGASEAVRTAYSKIKADIVNNDAAVVLNPQKYYISVRKEKNKGFFLVRRKKLILVVMSPEDETRRAITQHHVKSLTPGVQRFWNGPSCSIVIENAEHLGEVTALLQKLLATP
jgi:predicted transport protein